MKNNKIKQVSSRGLMALLLMGTMGQAQAMRCLFAKAKPAIVIPIIKKSAIRRAGAVLFNGMKRHKLTTALGAAVVTGFIADKLYASRVTKSQTGKYEQYASQKEAVSVREAVVRDLEGKYQALQLAEKKLNNAQELVDRSNYELERGEGAKELARLREGLANLLTRAKNYYGEGVSDLFATHEKAEAEQARAANLANSTKIYRDEERAESAREIVRQFERIEKLHAAHGKLEADVKQAQDEFNALLSSDANIAAVVSKIDVAKVALKKTQDELAKVAPHAALKDAKQKTLLKRAYDYVRAVIDRYRA